MPPRVNPVREMKELVVSKFAITFVLSLAATAVNAQEVSGKSPMAGIASVDGTRPFLFDGRMRGDGARLAPSANARHPNAGTLIVQPKASQPDRER